MEHTNTPTVNTAELSECARRCARLVTRDYGADGEPAVAMPERGVTLLRRCESWCCELVGLVGQYPVLTERRLLPDNELAPWYRFELIVGDVPSKVLAGAGLKHQRRTPEDPALWAEAEQLMEYLGAFLEHTRRYVTT